VDVADEFGVDDVVEDTSSTTSGAADNRNDSDATVDYDPPAQLVVDGTSPPTNDSAPDDESPDADDDGDAMWSRCGSIAWKRQCPPPSRHRAHNVLADQRGTARWTVAFFFNVIDIAAYNALVLWITANPNWHRGKSHVRRLFLREPGMSLTDSHASERLTQPSGKRRRIQACARRSGILADRSSLASSKSSGDGRRRRCNACPRHLERKTSRSCHTCGVSICKDHSTVL